MHWSQLIPTRDEVFALRETKSIGLMDAKKQIIRERMKAALASMSGNTMDAHTETLHAVLTVLLDKEFV